MEREASFYNDPPAYRDRELTFEDLAEINELLNDPMRNPNACVSKGQLKRLTEQLLVRNHLLEKQVTELLRDRHGKHPKKHP